MKIEKSTIQKFISDKYDIEKRLLELSQTLSDVDPKMYTYFNKINHFSVIAPDPRSQIFNEIDLGEIRVWGEQPEPFSPTCSEEINSFYVKWLYMDFDKIIEEVKTQKEERENFLNEQYEHIKSKFKSDED